MTLSFTELVPDVKPGNHKRDLPQDVRDGVPFADFLGDVLNKERVTIDRYGNQLRMGSIIAERDN